MSYLTDGMHLYEVVDVVLSFTLVIDCRTEERRCLNAIERAICSAVPL